jgi:hypothetical protein
MGLTLGRNHRRQGRSEPEIELALVIAEDDEGKCRMNLPTCELGPSPVGRQQ